MKQYVQHISGQGKKWEVHTEYPDYWLVYTGLDHPVCFVYPKSEYRLCEPPEEWEDVTDEYTVNGGRVISYNGEGYQCIRSSDRIRKINHLHNGPCFIIERKKS
jgi:hypothetical protein